MTNFSEREIKEALNNWKVIISKYQMPDAKKAVIQIFNSFGPFFALWVVMYFTYDYSYWLTLGLAVINAFFLVRIFIIQHDCGHQSFLRSKRLNNLVGVFCSFFSSIPFRYWAKVHNHHHGHSGQLEMSNRDIGDIKFLTVKEYASLSWLRRTSYRVFRSPFILFGLVPFIYLTFSNRLPMINLKGWTKVRRSQILNNLLMAGIYALLGYFIGWQKFFLLQVPIIFIFSIIAFWFFYVQHQHEETYKEWKNNWDFVVSALRGATHYKLPKLFQWLTGNIGFHHIHHLSSLIPNYHLERCYKENPILNKFVTSLTFTESLKCIHNDLWDQDQQRMISFQEYKRQYKRAS